MSAKPMFYPLGLCLLVVTIAAAAGSRSRFEAHTTGAKELTLAGSAEFGTVRGANGSGPFVLALGAQSRRGPLHSSGRHPASPRSLPAERRPGEELSGSGRDRPTGAAHRSGPPECTVPGRQSDDLSLTG
jgi:hypothetical protein